MKSCILNTSIVLRNHDSWLLFLVFFLTSAPQQLKLEGTVKHLSLSRLSYSRVPRTTASWVYLSNFKNGDLTTFPGYLLQCLTALHSGKVFSCIQAELPMFQCILQFSNVKLQFSKMIALL